MRVGVWTDAGGINRMSELKARCCAYSTGSLLVLHNIMKLTFVFVSTCSSFQLSIRADKWCRTACMLQAGRVSYLLAAHLPPVDEVARARHHVAVRTLRARRPPSLVVDVVRSRRR